MTPFAVFRISVCT